MNLLVLNAGSGSQKSALFDLPDAGPLPDEPPAPLWEAEIDATAPGQPAGQLFITVRPRGRPEHRETVPGDRPTPARVAVLLRTLWAGDGRVLGGPGEIGAVGHRVVHGGEEFDRATAVSPEVEAAIERLAAFSPLHNRTNLEGIRTARETLGGNVPQFAVFDTAFHRTLPDAAATYAGPHEWLTKKIRRYGFHGTSFRWASARAARLLGRDPADPDLRLLLAHLGGGCSLCATVGGRSVDTTMGFTPLDGIAMSSRSGAVDPGILLYLLREGATADELERTLNKESGLKGLSGLAGDTRVIVPAMNRGDARARLAMEVFNHRLRAGFGAMLAALDGHAPDAVVFTDGIAESEPSVRAAVCAGFRFLGLDLDAEKNAANPLDTDLATPGSAVRALLVKARENWQIAREVHGAFAPALT